MISITEEEYIEIEKLFISLHFAFPDKEWNKNLIKWRNIRKDQKNRVVSD